jgi:streptogramin lyase
MRRWIDPGLRRFALLFVLTACQPVPSVAAPPGVMAGQRILDQLTIAAASKGLGCWTAGIVATDDGYWFSARAPGRIYRVTDRFEGSSAIDRDVVLEAVTRIAGRQYLVDADRMMIVAYERGRDAVAVTRAGDQFGTDVRPESSPDGTPTADARLQTPMAVAATADGALLVTETAEGRVRRLDLDGEISTLADGLDVPTSLAVAPDGSVVIVEAGAGRVRRWRQGSGLQVIAGDLPFPDGVAVGPDGTVWITGVGEGTILAVRPDGSRQMMAVAGLQDPGPVAVAGDGLLVIDRADASVWRVGAS